jgi:hypothetical protein
VILGTRSPQRHREHRENNNLDKNLYRTSRNCTLVAQRKVLQRQKIEQTRKTQEQIISNLCALSLSGP